MCRPLKMKVIRPINHWRDADAEDILTPLRVWLIVYENVVINEMFKDCGTFLRKVVKFLFSPQIFHLF
jgi:hypothetical protein